MAICIADDGHRVKKMKNPPAEWSDLVTLGMSATASVGSDGTTVTIDPAPPKLVAAVLRAATVTPLPDFDADRIGYIKGLRDILLSETDWTQSTDSALSQVQREAWAAWREAVRGVPDADAGSGAIAWPSPPVVTASAVPQHVTRWQIRSWLWRAKGITPATVSAMLEQIQDVGARTQAMIDWGDAPIVRRDHPMIGSLGAALGMNAAAVDQAFREAAALEG